METPVSKNDSDWRGRVVALGGACLILATPNPAVAQQPIPAASPAPQDQPAPTSIGDPSGNTSAPQLGDIIVTATRRPTTLIETPVAMSSTSAAVLQDRQLRNLADLATQIPGIQFGTQYTTNNVNIRGVGGSGINTQGSDPGVAFHLDGVYLAQTGLAAGAFLDVDRVEVLRGPQGTLFGRNATGGAVNVISRTPTEDLEAEVGASASFDPAQAHVDGFVSGPLVADKLLVRVSARSDYNRGYTANRLASGPGPLDDEDRYAVRGQLEGRLGATLVARVAVDYGHRRDDGQGAFLLGAPGVDASGQSITLSPAEVAAQDAAATGTPGALVGDLDRRTTYANQSYRHGSFLGMRGTLEWATGLGNARLLGAYDKVRADTLSDGDGTDLDFTSTFYFERSHQYYGEALFSSKRIGIVEFVVGANLFKQVSDETVKVPIAGLPAPVTLPSHLDTWSYAAFSHLDLHLTKAATVFGGGRYTRDRKQILEANNFVNGGQPLLQAAAWGKVTYEAGARYALAPAVEAYFKYATGFKGGGFSGGALAPAFSPETNTNLEAGLKGRYYHRRLEANIAVFSMGYDNLQVNQVIGATAVTRNAARARIRGGEIEIVGLITPSLRAEFNASHLDTRFTEFLTADAARPVLGTLDLSGNRLPNSPRFSYSGGLYYSPVLLPTGEITLGARYYWRSLTYFSEFNIPVASQDANGRVDLSINYTSADRNWQLGLFARNVTDEKVVSSVQIVSALLNSAALGRLDPSREIGFQVRHRF